MSDYYQGLLDGIQKVEDALRQMPVRVWNEDVGLVLYRLKADVRREALGPFEEDEG